MILREMPAIWDKAFKPWFYSRWGRENCIIAARTRKAEYPTYQQRLSIKTAWGGRENYHVDGRRIAVDDETYVILNEGRTYASTLRATAPVTSFSIFFRPGMAEEVVRALVSRLELLLDLPEDNLGRPIEFCEHVRRHDRQITPVLRFIFRHVEAGVTDEAWYEEQLYFLLDRMLRLRIRDRIDTDLIPAARISTRKELFRRVSLAVDFIHCNFSGPISLKEIAAAALLSPFHCLRVFKAVHGKTPTAYLNERRVETARRLLRASEHSVSQVAAAVGFSNRSTLYRQLRMTQRLRAPETPE
jgi:AraC family transcriptional regulator